MKTVRLIINGREISAPEGATILEAARENDIYIPTLCYHPRLSPLGQCRLCLVEVEGLDKPVTACDNPVQEGMVVTTDTPAICRAREDILNLVISTHPFEDCLTCEKSGACELQDKAYCFGIELPAPLGKPLLPGLQEEDPFIVRDEQKCILCGRCLQVCNQGAGAFVFSLVGNGISTRVVPSRSRQETTLELAGCIYCGQCLDVCPVGALTERTRLEAGREWEFHTAAGICLECALNCPLERHTLQGKQVRATSPREGSPFQGLCRTGKFPETEGERILKPLLRDGDGLREANYDQAFRVTISALGNIQKRSGGGCLAVLADGRCSNEESYLFQKLARAGLGSNHIDLGTTPGWVKAAVALHDAVGPCTGPSLNDLSRSASGIFVLGSDPQKTHPVLAMAIRRASRFCGAPVVWIGCGAEESGEWADLHLIADEGTLPDLLKVIAAAKEGRPCDHLAERCKVSVREIVQAARWYDCQGYTLVLPSFYRKAGDAAVDALLDLARAGGQLGQNGCNLWLLPPQTNARGILENGGSPLFLAGYSPVGDSRAREEIENIWGRQLPAENGFYREQVLSAIRARKIKGLLLIGNWDHEDLELDGLEFLGVITSSLYKAARNADAIFPALLPFEKEGYFTSASGETSLNRPTEKPAVMEDWRIAARLLNLHLPDLGSDYPCLESVREEIKMVSGKKGPGES